MTRLYTILIVGLICEAVGVVLLSRGLKEISGWLFTADDLRAPKALAEKLRAQADPVSELIWSRLSPEQQRALAEPAADAGKLPHRLAEALNGLLRQATLYDPPRFSRASLSQRTRELAARAPQGSDLIELNRLLLEDAYPQDLKKQRRDARGLRDILQLVGRGVANLHILLGVFFEALFFAGLLMLMSRADVSFVWPLTSLSFVVTTIAARIYLHEHVSLLRWSGVCLIMMGAALISWTERQSSTPPPAAPVLQSPDRSVLPSQ